MNSIVLAAQIVHWFNQNQRDLPWRRTRDPYAIWISEIMLQQTQVKTVIPYWERWMHELPSITALAEAPPDRVLKLWEGLGYYSRARNLQKAAQQIVRDHGAIFPTRLEDILSLPGVGRYTAGAIASIAFNQPAPVLDGNVIRVLSRHYGIRGDPKSKVTNGMLWKKSEALVKSAIDRSALNQGLMEIGALLCRVSDPLCPQCPIQKNCYARRKKLSDELPETPRRPKATARIFRALLIRRNGHIQLRQRPAGVVNAGFWELPNIEVQSPSSSPLLCQIKHSITRYKITLEVVAAKTSCPKSRWIPLSDLPSLPLVNAHRKVLQMLGFLGSTS